MSLDTTNTTPALQLPQSRRARCGRPRILTGSLLSGVVGPRRVQDRDQGSRSRTGSPGPGPGLRVPGWRLGGRAGRSLGTTTNAPQQCPYDGAKPPLRSPVPGRPHWRPGGHHGTGVQGEDRHWHRHVLVIWHHRSPLDFLLVALLVLLHGHSTGISRLQWMMEHNNNTLEYKT
jgi:hypothetical protein